MDKFVTDQAEGLRRLLSRDGPQVIAVTGNVGAGRTTTVVNLATALTAVGRQVLVIDECCDDRSFAVLPGGAYDVGRIGRFDAVLRGELRLADAIDAHACGFGVLMAPRGNGAHYVGEPLGKLLADVADIVLIDAQLDDEGALSPLALNAHDVLLVTRTDAQAITVTYACIKRLHFAHAIAQFRVIANHVHADAQIVLDNLVGVASRYLSVALERAGCVAADPHMPRAVALARPIVDAFPSTAAARDFRRIAAELPHWPLRPALAALAVSLAARAGGADALAAGDERAVRLTNVPEVSTVTSIAEAATAHASWQTGPSVRRRPTHHA